MRTPRHCIHLIFLTVLILSTMFILDGCDSDSPVDPDSPTTGTIVVDASPSTVTAAWLLSGPDAYAGNGTGDRTLTDLAPGEYTITWLPVEGWVTPAPVTQALVAGATLTFAGVYTETVGLGSIMVDASPDSLNAPWSLAGPSKVDQTGTGDLLIEDLAPGAYTLTWSAIADWNTPAEQTLTLAPDALLTFSGTYEPAAGVGTVVVDAEPDDLMASWAITGPLGFTQSGSGDATLTDVPAGNYGLTWGQVPGWERPPGQFLLLEAGGTLTFSGTYEEEVLLATVILRPRPDGLDAPWVIVGPESYSENGSGETTLTDLAEGSYTVTWGEVEGYVTAATATQTVTGGTTRTFVGTYVAPLGSMASIPPMDQSVPTTFTMGSTVGPYEDVHQVTLTRRFEMATTEVTNAQYAAALQWAYENGYVTRTETSVRSAFDGSTDELIDIDATDRQITFVNDRFVPVYPYWDRPALNISWFGAAAYCDWMSLFQGLPRSYDHSDWSCNSGDPYGAAGYRLPTEAEWEFACRAGTTTPFNTGDCLENSNYDGHHPYTGCPEGSYIARTRDVATYDPNAWGLHDMHGNLKEWCNDWADFDYGGDATDPVGAATATFKAARGGHYALAAANCRSANRQGWAAPYSANIIKGFRPVRTRP